MNPTRLPDGTLVVPLADEDEDEEDDLSKILEEGVEVGLRPGYRRRAGGYASRWGGGENARYSS